MNLKKFNAFNELDQKARFCERKDRCSFIYSSISLGILIIGMDALSMLNSRQPLPWHGYNFKALEEAVKEKKAKLRHRLLWHILDYQKLKTWASRLQS